MNQVPLYTQAKLSVVEAIDRYNANAEFIDTISYTDVYLIWHCKTLQNWKACLSVDGCTPVFFEVTHNGNTGETYVDMYFKKHNYVM